MLEGRHMMRRQMLGKSMLEVPVVAAGCMRIQGMDETEVAESGCWHRIKF